MFRSFLFNEVEPARAFQARQIHVRNTSDGNVVQRELACQTYRAGCTGKIRGAQIGIRIEPNS